MNTETSDRAEGWTYVHDTYRSAPSVLDDIHNSIVQADIIGVDDDEPGRGYGSDGNNYKITVIVEKL